MLLRRKLVLSESNIALKAGFPQRCAITEATHSVVQCIKSQNVAERKTTYRGFISSLVMNHKDEDRQSQHLTFFGLILGLTRFWTFDFPLALILPSAYLSSWQSWANNLKDNWDNLIQEQQRRNLEDLESVSSFEEEVPFERTTTYKQESPSLFDRNPGNRRGYYEKFDETNVARIRGKFEQPQGQGSKVPLIRISPPDPPPPPQTSAPPSSTSSTSSKWSKIILV